MIEVIKILFIIIVVIMVFELINKIFNKIQERKSELYLNFLKGCIQGLVIIYGTYKIGNTVDSLKTFTTALVTNSSLLVVVMGFAMQETLNDILSGLFISIFKPFNIGDRVHLVNMNITGTIEKITLRHTIIKDYVTSSSILIPNSKMNKEILQNTDYMDTINKNFIDITIDINADEELASEIIKKIALKYNKRISPNYNQKVFIRNISIYGIELRTTILANTISENFEICSKVRREILKEFKTNNVEFSYYSSLNNNVLIKKAYS